MRTEFDAEEVKKISIRVAEVVVGQLKPLLKAAAYSNDDTIFDQDELSEYLKVSRSWVDQKISQNEIPYFKCGKYPRFKKSEIDKWISKNSIQPVPELQLVTRGKK
jgi:excisionase family DNA binding protein